MRGSAGRRVLGTACSMNSVGSDEQGAAAEAGRASGRRRRGSRSRPARLKVEERLGDLAQLLAAGCRRARAPARRRVEGDENRSDRRGAVATAASIVTTSVGYSTRGTSATRPAMTRPLSSSTMTVWLRSARKVRTIGLLARAVADQSTRRNSSSSEYSRSARTRCRRRGLAPTADRPRGSERGRPAARLRPSTGTAGGPQASTAATGADWRDASPSGPSTRTTNSPRREQAPPLGVQRRPGRNPAMGRHRQAGPPGRRVQRRRQLVRQAEPRPSTTGFGTPPTTPRPSAQGDDGRQTALDRHPGRRHGGRPVPRRTQRAVPPPTRSWSAATARPSTRIEDAATATTSRALRTGISATGPSRAGRGAIPSVLRLTRRASDRRPPGRPPVGERPTRSATPT